MVSGIQSRLVLTYKCHGDFVRIRMPRTCICQRRQGNPRQNIQSDYCVDNRKTAVKWQLRYLCSRKFAVRIPELNHGLVVLSRISIGHHAIETCFLHRVVHSNRVVQIHRFRYYRVLGRIGGIRCQNEGTDFILFTKIRVDTRLIANGLSLLIEKMSKR